MKFSDLNGRAKKEEAPEPRVREKKTAYFRASAEPAAGPPNPLDAPLPDIPGKLPPVPEAAPAAAPEAPPAGIPEKRSISRKDRQRKDEAAVRASARPFPELDAQAREIYSRNIALAKELIGQIDRGYVEKYGSIMRQAELNSQALSSNPVLLSYTRYATADDYLYAHSANVAVISQAMGLALGLERSAVNFLGFCALAHDLGMIDHSKLAKQENRLTDAEYSEIMLHPEAGAARIDRFLDMDGRLKEQAKKIILQVHERIDAGGYPGRLTNEEISFSAQIIGIADVYEAMSHPRSWRPAGHPHNVMKHLIDKEGHGFNSRVVKALIEVFSIYPPGSLVALSTGEIAGVVQVNPGSLTRPVVSVLLDPDFSPALPRLADLLEHPLTGIERIVEEEELLARNPKFAARQELERWWVDW
ncbi:MAG: hypothetical protein A2X28_00775 [Elusimicrobia bacterium GWA2_56_46]|nr:MAG: hypothetical protein A2X28_00775 [Elusimicrobia bacterium GWA2_56_46]OGR55898.1 MAG: hypothetical protein A2X39_06140 [Elusimicrobia bacterium GWC2_56_31]HBB67553.1 hypothetical protein [Elusimicrobiota bacterium]HBW22167.1 hypothetical protein [Elusimicrobiota bacterium]